MSEMLGNQYFMARNYKEAIREFEPIYLTNPTNKSVKRKLIIGYTQTGKIMKAFELFTSLVQEDISYIINADPIFDDCPCPEIIKQLNPTQKDTASAELNIYNGILWLYCDKNNSIKFFRKALKDFSQDSKLKQVINRIEEVIRKSN